MHAETKKPDFKARLDGLSVSGKPPPRCFGERIWYPDIHNESRSLRYTRRPCNWAGWLSFTVPPTQPLDACCRLQTLLVTMVLYVIGLGLGDEKDITVRGLEAVRSSAKVVLEHYTSILGVDKTKLVRGV